MIRVSGPWFKDVHGRTLLLRGVNLSGSAKTPVGMPTHVREGFFEHRDVSFVGRPLSLEEADEHFARLRAWGFTFLRFLVTWEAIEHTGPGIYDETYLDYLTAIVEKAGAHGLSLFIDPHQDVWSRFTGGDGAPGWTLEAVGFDITKLQETGAALVHALHGDPFPRMIWPTNYGKFATATMWTLFFGGNDFAPQTEIAGEPVQDYLQRHYIEAIKQVAQRLKDFPHVVGYDTLNEPSSGFIGCRDLHTRVGVANWGESPTVFQGMALGAGFPQEVEFLALKLTGIKKTGVRILNPKGHSVWLEDVAPLWQVNGVWGVDADCNPVVLRPDHFARVGEREVDFYRDYFRPFANRYAQGIRAIDPDALIFVEGAPNEHDLRWTETDAQNVVHAGHWYDGVTLATKRYLPGFTVDIGTMKPVVGRGAVRRVFARQLADLKQVSEQALGGVPTLIGEVGIPFDLQNAEAYRTGDFSVQVQALNRSLQALEDNLLSYTLWNYTADNTNARGDQWNGEDLSLFSRDQQQGTGDLNDGGRALEAALRPHPQAIAGEPLHQSFDLSRGVFTFTFRHDSEVTAPTVIYVPNFQFPEGYGVEVSDGHYRVDRETQQLLYRHTLARAEHTVTLWDIRKGTLAEQTRWETRQRWFVGLTVAAVVGISGLVLRRVLGKRR
ncbi:MAG: cellulase family glycosylhydrolase [Anaerolineae bacterium]|nr:cellulase family glycosylhydrolase [Anaerolineae bacterium]